MINQLHKRLWLIFAQAVTLCLALLFVLRIFFPDFISNGQTIVVKQVESSARLSLTGSYSYAAKKAMPSVVNIFTSKKVAVNPHQKY